MHEITSIRLFEETSCCSFLADVIQNSFDMILKLNHIACCDIQPYSPINKM